MFANELELQTEDFDDITVCNANDDQQRQGQRQEQTTFLTITNEEVAKKLAVAKLVRKDYQLFWLDEYAARYNKTDVPIPPKYQCHVTSQ
jgi:hypothetical protein